MKLHVKSYGQTIGTLRKTSICPYRHTIMRFGVGYIYRSIIYIEGHNFYSLALLMNTFQKHNQGTWIQHAPSLRPQSKYFYNTSTSTPNVCIILISLNTPFWSMLMLWHGWFTQVNKQVHIELFELHGNITLHIIKHVNYSIQQNKTHGMSFLWSRDLIHHILPSGFQWSTSCRGQ